LSTYYVAVKVADGGFYHMVAYFLLVMGDTPSLWFNNLLAGSINAWADLSQAFTSNFQATYNHPRNAFNLVSIVINPKERLCDHQPVLREPQHLCWRQR
jgi:hypothetical protein